MRHEAERLGIEYKGPIRYRRKIVLYGFTDPIFKSDFSVKPYEDVEAKLRRFRMIRGIKKDKHVSSTRESLIDFPKDGLNPLIWDYVNGKYTLKPEVKDHIIHLLHIYPDVDLTTIAKEVHITGSMCTNQYDEDTDIDVHIIASSPYSSNKPFRDTIFRWYKDNRDFIAGYIKHHPIEVYIQINPYQEYLSDGVYDLLNDAWIKGPKIVSMEFDPYEEYTDLIDDVAAEADDADLLIGELKRDVIDYSVVKDAVKRFSPDQRKKLIMRLRSKLEEIESGIERLLKIKGKWTDARKLASQPKSIEQALRDINMARSWRDKNVVFKFLDRYNYLRLISDLERMIEDDGLQSQEVNVIGRMLGV